MSSLRRQLALALALVGASLLFALPASAATITHTVDRGAGDDGFWTAERMARAVPPQAPRGAAGVPAAARRVQPRYVSAPVPNPRKAPFRAAGKVFFQLGGNKLYVCSAAIVKAPSESLVWTAAHCLRDTGPKGKFAKHWVFVPAYDRGDAPYGGWEAKSMFLPRAWALGNEKYDFGAAVLRRDKGKSVRDAAGAALRVGFNSTAKQGWTVIGYPEAKRWQQNMWSCAGPFFRRDRMRWQGPNPIGIGCDMTGGASGGPWISAAGKLGAVSSYIYTRGPDVLYGTYLGDKAKRLYRKVRDKR